MSVDGDVLVVADATPLHYLVLIEEVDLLRQLYGAIVVPPAVVRELTAGKTPLRVRDWMNRSPGWLKVAVMAAQPREFPGLGAGENEAIALAQERQGSLLLTDDRLARMTAEGMGIQTVPTIRILSAASALSMVNFDEALRRLQETNFRVSPRIIEEIRRQVSGKEL